MHVADARRWLPTCVDATKGPRHWTTRARLLAADLMDGQGRFKASSPSEDVDAAALNTLFAKSGRSPGIRTRAVGRAEDRFGD